MNNHLKLIFGFRFITVNMLLFLFCYFNKINVQASEAALEILNPNFRNENKNKNALKEKK